jgi:hypothetical protein
MAPKKPTGNKKKKIGTSAALPANVQDKFTGPSEFERFQDMQTRKFWYEKEIQITPNGKYRSIVEAIEDLNWGKLIDPELFINVELVREFYANALPDDPTQPFLSPPWSVAAIFTLIGMPSTPSWETPIQGRMRMICVIMPSLWPKVIGICLE